MRAALLTRIVTAQSAPVTGLGCAILQTILFSVIVQRKMEFEFVAESFTLKKTPTSKSYYSKHKRVLIRKHKIPTEGIKKIEQEVANLKFLNHRHIVSILDCFSDMDKQHLSVVTEPLQFTLRNLINGNEKPNESLIWRAISHISDGLNYLHEQNPPIIFTNLKPEYIAGIGRFLPKVEWKLLKNILLQASNRPFRRLHRRHRMLSGSGGSEERGGETLESQPLCETF